MAHYVTESPFFVFGVFTVFVFGIFSKNILHPVFDVFVVFGIFLQYNLHSVFVVYLPCYYMSDVFDVFDVFLLCLMWVFLLQKNLTPRI